MSLKESVSIGRRFLRAVRIDTDVTDYKALEGFVCPQSFENVLLTMAGHIAETGHGAFTWTGPYGSGKSSLIVALFALLSGQKRLRSEAAKIFTPSVAKEISSSFQSGSRGWRVLPVVGRRGDPVQIIGDSMRLRGLVNRTPRGGWTEDNLVRSLGEVAASEPKNSGGLIIFVDEMGKFLEGSVQDGTDINVFQQLAEAASRSDRRLIVVGVLHQAFEEYANRLSREMRDEWAKVQGRYVDLAVSTASEEQIDLIARAILSETAAPNLRGIADAVAVQLRRDPDGAKRLAVTLERCWPLHPVVACLLGPISRRRFGQNQRSIFGFLNSAEPYGFQAFLSDADYKDLYWPFQLWDYLRANLEPSILASPDGHRWATAAESIERCELRGGDELQLQLLKTIAVIDLFKERSGLLPSLSLLGKCLPNVSTFALKRALDQLDSWSLTLFKRFLDAYSIFAGSDFDIDQAIGAELSDVDNSDIERLRTLAGLQPVLAKKHYHETGALRWFEVNLTTLANVAEVAKNYRSENGAVGQFLLAVPTAGEGKEEAWRLCREAARHSHRWDVVVGIASQLWMIVGLARELIALEKVRSSRPELAGDPVARREVAARLASLRGQIESELNRAFDSAMWFRKHYSPKIYGHAGLNELASELANRRFAKSPRLHNELLNRDRPSGSAIAAQNALLRRMVLHEGEPLLGIKGYPAERGLLASILDATGIYVQEENAWRISSPLGSDPCRLAPLWEAAICLVKKNRERVVPLSEVYDLWRAPPFGVKDGLMPMLAVAFILAQRQRLVAYREGVFRAKIDDVDIDYLTKDASTIELRWMDLSEMSRKLLTGMADIVRELDEDSDLTHLEPIDVARGLVGIFERLPPWTKRTMRLSQNAIQFRNLFKRARDPNEFLFDDVPSTVEPDLQVDSESTLLRVILRLREGLEELLQAYPSMLQRLRDIMLAELQVPNLSPQSIAELRSRAENIQQLAGDFHLEAFVGRLMRFDGTDEAFEGIASLAANKPPRDWVDPDLNRTMVNIADMSQKFLRAETFARIAGRPEKRQAMAVVIGMDGRPAPILKEFQVGDVDRASIKRVVTQVESALECEDTSRRNIILAALAELSVRYMSDPPQELSNSEQKAAL